MALIRPSSRNELELLARKAAFEARRSFWAYRRVLNPTMLLAWWQHLLAYELQQFWLEMQAGNRPVLLVEAPPQHGKSKQIVDFISWVAGLNPDLRTIYASYSDNLGQRANRELQRAFDLQRYQRVFPGTVLPARGSNTGTFVRNSSLLQYVNREGSFRNTTVQGPITGEGLDLGVIDDPIKSRAEANSITTRNKVWDWLNDDFFTRLSKDAGILGIMTRWHVDDPFGRLIERGGNVRRLRFPAIAEYDDEYRDKGEPLFPEHKPIEFLNERKRFMTEASWQALYQQNPIIPEGGMFQRGSFGYIDVLPRGCKLVRGWDLAATADPGAAATASVLLAEAPDRRLIIANVTRDQIGPGGVERKLKETAEEDRDNYGFVKGSIPQDPGQAGKSQAHNLLTGALFGHPYSASPESGDKELRAMGLAAQVEIGNVYLLRGDWNSEFIEEAVAFPNGKFKDQIDAASRAFNELLPEAKQAGVAW